MSTGQQKAAVHRSFAVIGERVFRGMEPCHSDRSLRLAKDCCRRRNMEHGKIGKFRLQVLNSQWSAPRFSRFWSILEDFVQGPTCHVVLCYVSLLCTLCQFPMVCHFVQKCTAGYIRYQGDWECWDCLRFLIQARAPGPDLEDVGYVWVAQASGC